MDQKFKIIYGIGYQGSTLHVIDDSSALAICGNSISSYSFAKGLSTPLLLGSRFGISVSSFDPLNQRIAYAEKGLHPSVYLYHSTKKQLLCKISDIAEVEVSAIAFSKDGHKLITASSEPDFRLCLWDLRDEQPSKIAEGHLDSAVEFASFNPANSDQICVSGSGSMSLWTYEHNFQRRTFTCKGFFPRPYEPHCHVWSEDGKMIYIGCLKGEVLSYNSTLIPQMSSTDEDESEPSFLKQLVEGNFKASVDANTFSASENKDRWQLLRVSQAMEKITSICLGQLHLVIVDVEGHVCWLSLLPAKSKEKGNIVFSDTNSVDMESCTTDRTSTSGETINTVTENLSRDQARNRVGFEMRATGNTASMVIYSMNLEVTQVTNMTYTTEQTKLVIGAASGCIIIVRVNKQGLLSMISGKSGTALTESLAIIEWRSTYHYGPVLGFATLGNGKFVLTSGQDGTVRVWEADRGKELSRHCFKSPQLCIDSHEGSNTAVTGSQNGSLCMFKVDSMGRSAIVFQNKLHISAIDKVSFNKSSHQLAASCKDDGRLYFLRCGLSDVDELDLLGYTTFDDSIISIAWDIPTEGTDQAYIFVSLARGEIVKVKAPTQAVNGDLFLDNKSLNCISFRTQVPLLSFVVGKYYLEKEKVERKIVWGIGQDKRMQQYRIPQTVQGWTGSSGNAVHAHFNMPGHAKIGTALVLHWETSTLITGAEDGALQIRDAVLDPLRQPQKVVDVQLYDGYLGGITCLIVGDSRLFIGGANGAIYCAEVPAIGLKITSDATGINAKARVSIAPERTNHDAWSEGDPLGQLSMIEKYAKMGDSRSVVTSQGYRTEIKKKIQKIKQEFYDIVDLNEKAPELEKLLPSELIVDTDLECELRSDGEKRVISVHEQVIRENLKKDIMVERIKQECWKDVAEAGKHLWPFLQGCRVPNFPLHHKDQPNNRAANVAKYIRIIEMQENDYTKELKLVVSSQMDIPTAPGSIRSESSDTVGEDDISCRSREDIMTMKEGPSDPSIQLTNFETAAPKIEDASPGRRSSIMTARDSSPGKIMEVENITNRAPNDSVSPLPTPEEDQEENESPTAELLDKGPISNLLYGSFELSTPKRKRTQRFLLYKELQLAREAFNKRFVALEENKESIIEKIKEMTTRIIELQRKLGLKDEFVLPQLDCHDDFESIFVVKDDEIHVLNYMALKKKKEDEMNDKKRLKQGNNDVERALQDMMGGKLEQKKEEVIVDTELEKPAWMHGNPKNFTKEQIKEMKEFDAKLKAIKEEKEKKQRAQEFEMRKLKNDIQDLMNTFDESLLQFFDNRLQEEAKCLQIEETITRLSMEIEDEEFLDEEKEAELAKKLDQLKTVKGRSVAVVTEFKREVDEFKAKYDAVVGEDKTLDRNFKKDFSDCVELIPLLYRHFRKRKPQAAKIISKDAPKSPRQSVSPDRRKSVQLRVKSPPRSSMAMVKSPRQTDPFNERPEEIDVDIWNRLLAVRNRKILKEDEVKCMGDMLTKMNDYMNRLVGQDDLNRKKIEKALRSLAEFREMRERKKRNFALSLHIKQGLVEIELKPLEGDYIDAALLPRGLIDEFNEVILREANIKVKILIGMKDFKRGSYEIQWDIQRLEKLEKILIEKIRYIQLLRNTKALQNLIKNGEVMEKATDNSTLECRLEHTKALHHKRIEEKKLHLEQLKNRVKLLRSRSLTSQEEAASLYQQYIFRTNLCEKSMELKRNEESLKERQRSIVSKQRLHDKAKEQDRTISQLEKDCSNTKERYFPSFPS